MADGQIGFPGRPFVFVTSIPKPLDLGPEAFDSFSLSLLRYVKREFRGKNVQSGNRKERKKKRNVLLNEV